jgi:DNA-binding MarR family transcriptional regulator
MANQNSQARNYDFEARYPDASATATDCAMNLVLTADLLVKRIAALLRPFDLTPASGLALSILADAAAPLHPHQIAERLIISRATVTGLMDSLERRGYVTRTQHPSDRRMLLIEPTDAGRQVADAFRPVVHAQEKLWMAALNTGEQEELVQLLQRVQASLNAADS